MIIIDTMMEKLSEPVTVNQKCIIDAEVLSLIDKKVSVRESREKVKRVIKDVLFAPNSIIDIDVNEITDLFQEGGEIHTIETSTDATKENRMEVLMEQIRKSANSYEPYNHVLVYFFISESHPMLMEELQPFSDWIESVPDEITIKWGLSVQPTQELRTIVLVQ